MKKFCYFLVLVLLSMHARMGSAADWLVLQNRSTVKFQFAQAGSDVTGAFGKFDAVFNLDPANLLTGNFSASIYVTSLTTGDKDRDEILRSADMFNVGKWPVARFKTLSIASKGKNRYEAIAELTIRDVTRNIRFPFDLDIQKKDTATLLHLKSKILIKRLSFGVGQGDWASTEWVGDDVIVMVDIMAENKN